MNTGGLLVLYPFITKYKASLESLQSIHPTYSNCSAGKYSSSPNMKSIGSIVSALCLSLATLPLIHAGPLATRASSPAATRPFTVSAFQSPYPVGQGITGYNMTAHSGNFYLSSATVQKAVLFVTGDGRAYLVQLRPSFVIYSLHTPPFQWTDIAAR